MSRYVPLNLPPDLVSRYAVGEINSTEVARRTGTSATRVLHELRRLGVDTSMSSRKLLRALRRLRSAPKFDLHKIPGKVIQLYRGGLSLRQVSSRFGLSHEGVRQILLRHGVVLRPGQNGHLALK
jgi:hypothetical protein